MNWLFKEEPTHYSWDDFARDGGTRWSGVKNPLAQKHLRSVKKGDLVFYYHTGDEKAVVGLAEVVAAPYPDPGAKRGAGQRRRRRVGDVHGPRRWYGGAAGDAAPTCRSADPAARGVGPPVVFRCDHPFLFAIRHRVSGAILFLSRVTDPTRQS